MSPPPPMRPSDLTGRAPSTGLTTSRPLSPSRAPSSSFPPLASWMSLSVATVHTPPSPPSTTLLPDRSPTPSPSTSSPPAKASVPDILPVPYMYGGMQNANVAECSPPSAPLPSVANVSARLTALTAFEEVAVAARTPGDRDHGPSRTPPPLPPPPQPPPQPPTVCPRYDVSAPSLTLLTSPGPQDCDAPT